MVSCGRLTLRLDPESASIAGIDLGGEPLVTGPIQATLWRAPTDNDGITTAWHPDAGRARRQWLDWGLDEPTIQPDRFRLRKRGEQAEITLTRRLVGTADEATHRTLVTVGPDATIRFDETITVPKVWTDLARVGVTFDVDQRFDQLRWFGLGPHETYPDRRSSALVGTWRSSVADQYHHYVLPQETGHHLETRWFELVAGRTKVRFSGDPTFGFAARNQTDRALTAARNLAEVEDSDHVEVHIDAAIRGLGTGACGPDTLAQYLVGPGRYAWSWQLGV